MDFLAIALGGALGSVLRFAVQMASRTQWGIAFPWGTLMVNLLGSLLIGFSALVLERQGSEAFGLRTWGIAGFLGGFTTFSAFSLESMQWIRNGQFAMALVYATVSVLGGVGLALIGYFVARLFFQT